MLSTGSAAATAAFGARLAQRLRPGDILCLHGPLGAGKTTLARGLIQAWTGRAEEAPSPTYTLVQTYDGPAGPLWHVDLYRLAGPDETLELGLEDAYGQALTVIEWPERLGRYTPQDRIELHLHPRGDTRMIEIIGFGRHAGVRFD